MDLPSGPELREMLPAIFNIATGLGFAMVLAFGLLARKAIKDWAGRLIGFGVLAITLGFFFFAQAVDMTQGVGAYHTLGAGASFFLAAVLVTGGLFLRARSAN